MVDVIFYARKKGDMLAVLFMIVIYDDRLCAIVPCSGKILRHILYPARRLTAFKKGAARAEQHLDRQYFLKQW